MIFYHKYLNKINCYLLAKQLFIAAYQVNNLMHWIYRVVKTMILLIVACKTP